MHQNLDQYTNFAVYKTLPSAVIDFSGRNTQIQKAKSANFAYF